LSFIIFSTITIPLSNQFQDSIDFIRNKACPTCSNFSSVSALSKKSFKLNSHTFTPHKVSIFCKSSTLTSFTHHKSDKLIPSVNNFFIISCILILSSSLSLSLSLFFLYSLISFKGYHEIKEAFNHFF
jgi:hypothetical protein